jgi:exosome complex component RRP45
LVSLIRYKHPPEERAPVPLAVHHTPFTFTFAFFSDTTLPAVLDPAQLEQRLSAGLLTIALNAQRELCVVQKMGGVPLAGDDLLRYIDVAVAQAKEMDKFVEARLREDLSQRVIEVR